MSTNRNKEQELFFTLMDLKDYIDSEGADMFLLDLELQYPETYDALVTAVKAQMAKLDAKRVPAILRKYRA